MSELNFKIIIEKDENGLFVASVPALPGCHTQGKTYEEVLKRIREAILLNLEVQSAKGQKIRIKSIPQTKFFGVEELTVRYA